MITSNRRCHIGGHHNHAARKTAMYLRGERRTVTDIDARATRRIAELLAIVRVYQRVVENNLDSLDATARLASGDARDRLADFLEREDVQ